MRRERVQHRINHRICQIEKMSKYLLDIYACKIPIYIIFNSEPVITPIPTTLSLLHSLVFFVPCTSGSIHLHQCPTSHAQDDSHNSSHAETCRVCSRASERGCVGLDW